MGGLFEIALEWGIDLVKNYILLIHTPRECG